MLTANPILNKALAGTRITEEEALELFDHASILDLAYTANEIRKKFHSDADPVTYVVQRNINYSNVCTANCSFCAFYTSPANTNKNNPAYVLDYATVIKPKIQELVDINGTEILFQGGHNPELGLTYYIDLFQTIKKDFPGVTLHALSPAEIVHIAEKEITPPEIYGDGTNRSKIYTPQNEDIKNVLQALKNAGMDSLPGAGAEILTESVRKIIAPLKITTETWLKVMEISHRLGFKSSATMMYGHVETYADRVEHLRVLRELQDQTHGFTAFVAWNFQKGETPLSKIMDSLEKQGKLPHHNLNSSGDDYLRTTAIARIYLDNFKNFQSSWVTQGHQLGQVALAFGCNDLGGNMMEENVVSAAGTTHRAAVKEMEYYIEASGHQARQRDTQYNLL
ncbi:MAG: radical SAM protein [Candidatus Caenarcaniphilales bacterium]|jgi:cyclic dehypoxanthinyl futalosine synthase|nr:radical SAM protein [Candidatus Caenarcaniphilales bacterium]